MGPIEVVARLKANSDDMVNGFRRASTAANQFSGNLNNMGGVAQRSFGMVQRYAMLGAGAMQTAAMAGATMGIRTAMANEQAIISFKTLLGSQQAASDMFGKLQQFAATTPFEFPQLRDAASKLLTTGVEAERVIPIMTALGDSTAAMGTGAEGISRAVYALQQMNLVGKITGQDMMQLANAGIPAWDALATAAGMSVQEVKKAVEQGKLQDSVALLMQGIEEYSGAAMSRVKGMMSEQAATLNGMMSTLKDEVNIALADMMQPAVAGIKEALPGITALVKQTFEGMTEPINKLVQQMVTAFEQLMPAMGPIVDAFSGIMVAALSAIVPLFASLASLLPELAPTFDALAIIIGDVAAILGPLITALATGLVPIINTIATAVAGMTGFFAGLTEALTENKVALGVLVAGFAAMKIIGTVNALLAAYKTGTMMATAQTWLFNSALYANPIGLLVLAIAGLVAGIIVMYNKFEWFRNGIKTVWNGVVEIFETGINGLLGSWEFFINLFIKGVNLLIKGWNALPFKKDIDTLKEVNLELDLTAIKLKLAGDAASASAADFRKFEEATKGASNATKALNQSLGGDRGYEVLQMKAAAAAGAGAGSLDKGSKAAKKKKTATNELKDKLEELRQKIKETYEDGIAKAEQALQNIIDKQNQYAASVSDSIMSVNPLTAGFQAITSAADAQEQVLTELNNTVADAIRQSLSFTGVLEAQRTAADGLNKAFGEQTQAGQEVATAQAKVNKISSMMDRTRVRSQRIALAKDLADATEELVAAQAKLAASNGAVANAQDQAAAAGNGFIDGLKKQLKSAQEFAAQITRLRALGLNEASLKQVMAAGADIGGAIANELITGGVDAINETNRLVESLEKTATDTGLDIANSFRKTGKDAASALLGAMMTEADKGIEFANKIKTLVQMGLNQDSLQAVLNSGVIAGTAIANALIGGGQTTIDKANLMQQNLKDAADGAALAAADKYYGLGVTLATNIVNGLKDEWAKLQPQLANMNLPQLQQTLDAAQKSVANTVGAVTTIAGGGAGATPPAPSAAPVTSDYYAAAAAAFGGPASLSNLTVAGRSRADVMAQFLDIVNSQFGQSWKNLNGFFNATGIKGMASTAKRKERWEDFAKANNVNAYAKGGLVYGPQMALVGEAGPEAIIPLSRLDQGGTSINVTVNAGIGTDGADVGRQIVDVLRQYERRNGRIPLRIGNK